MADGNQREKEPKEKCEIENCKICKLETFIFNDWTKYLSEELKSSEEFQKVKETLHQEKFYPPAEKIFAFTKHAKLEDIRVVIIGQDPYPEESHAMGLCFSVPSEIKKIPQSLENIFKELTTDIEGFKETTSGDLTEWAEQGVLLLNAVLTINNSGESKSHYGIGWEAITDQIVRSISLYGNNVVFMLWGKKAQEKSKQIKNPEKHEILECSHPCTRSANNQRSPFFTCKHFSKANVYLKSCNKNEIEWKLKN